MSLTQFADRFPTLIQRLRHSRISNRVAHAYLISGDNQHTIESFAQAWIASCICQSPTQEAGPCDACDACHRRLAGTYVDLHEIRPTSKMRTIPIDSVRDLEYRLNLKSSGGTRVAVLWEAETMMPAAQNAFLKTLEEPHPGTLLLLVTVSPSLLLPTIRSRCQVLALRDNAFAPEFPGVQGFYTVLSHLRQHSGASTASRVAAEISAIAASLKAECEERADLRRKEFAQARREQGIAGDAAKRLEAELNAQAAADYQARRTQLLSAIHTWFGNEFLRAQGVPDALLPNPELYSEHQLQAPQAAEARRNLRLAETLLQESRYNVDETTLFLNFCQNLCRRS